MNDTKPRTFTDAEIAKVDALFRIIRAAREPMSAKDYDEELHVGAATALRIAIATLTETLKPRQPASAMKRPF